MAMHPAFHIQCPRCGQTIEPAEDCPVCGNWLGEAPVRRAFGPVRSVMVKDEWRRADSLEDELLNLVEGARRGKLKALVLIHGWGASGVGGRLRRSVREHLDRFDRMDLIAGWLPGERFHTLADAGLGARQRGGEELERAARHWKNNPGVSLLLF